MSIKFIMHLARQDGNNQQLWSSIFITVSIAQLSQILEVVHCILSFVPSPPLQVIMQLSGRFFNLFAVLTLVPESRESVGFLLLLLAWTVAETTRSIFYAVNIYTTVPYVLTWLRYSVFIIAFPLGLLGELLAMFAAVPYVKSKPPHILSQLSTPQTISTMCDVVSYIMVFIFLAAFFNLYTYMLRGRQKALSPSSVKSKAKKK